MRIVTRAPRPDPRGTTAAGGLIDIVVTTYEIDPGTGDELPPRQRTVSALVDCSSMERWIETAGDPWKS